MNIDVATIDNLLLEHTAIVHYINELRSILADQAIFLLQASNHWDNEHMKELREW
jgi:hypothetical protein